MAVYLSLFAGAGQQFFTNAGVPLAGGKIYTYGAGGSTPQATYTTSAGNIAHSNPIQLDAAGRVPGGGEIWLTDTLVYKFQLETSTGAIIQTLDNVSASIGSAALVASSGSNLIGFIQAGTGATARTVQSKLRDSISVADFGAIGNGTSDDTTAVQNAINQASVGGYNLIFESGKTYLCSTLTPKSNVTLNLNGSTVKLKNATNWLLFDGTGASGSNFGIMNGILDCNKANNNANVNQSGGGIWLVGWNQILLQNVTINNAFRTSIVLNGCSDIVIDTVEQNNCGAVNAFGFFGYGLEAYNGTARMSIRNFYVNNMYGFGIHFFGCVDFAADNLKFLNLTQGGSAIAITWTQAERGRVSNVYCESVDGDNIEINASIDQTIENVKIVSAGDIPLIMGDNNTGQFNERVNIRNLSTTTTGGTYSARINFVKYCSFEHMNFDKNMDTTTVGGAVNDRNNVFRDSVVSANIADAWVYYKKFALERVAFNNFYVNYLDQYTAKVSNPLTSGSAVLPLAGSGVTYVDFNAFNQMGEAGFVAGDLQVVSMLAASTNTQSTYANVPFLGSNNNTTFNLGTAIVVNNATPRPVTIAADAANRRISLTNPSASPFYVKWSANLQIIGL